KSLPHSEDKKRQNYPLEKKILFFIFVYDFKSFGFYFTRPNGYTSLDYTFDFHLDDLKNLAINVNL
nr:hypothetical protein [Chitinophagales bacterium]